MNLLSISDVVQETKVPRNWINYQLQLGNLPEPSRLRGRRCFTIREADEIKDRYSAYLQAKLLRSNQKGAGK